MKDVHKSVWLLWIGTIGILAVLLISHTYNDIVITTRHGLNFWDILLEGKILAFYDLNITKSGNAFYTTEQSCAYNILLYIVFALWNFPLYLLERFANVDVMNNIACLVYAKLLPLTAMIATALTVKKILEALHVPQSQHNLILYLYISSSLLVTVVFITAQYDVLSLIFQLLGVYAFIKGNDRRFVIWFGIAFCFKFFALVIFIPLMLLRYKKVFQWVKCLAAVIAIWIPTKLPFWIYEAFLKSTNTIADGGGSYAVWLLKRMLISSNFQSILNIFIVVYAAIALWCYLQEYDSGVFAYKSIWACFVAYAAFFGLMDANPYWSVLLAPFVTLVIAMSPKHLYVNTLLEMIGYAGLIGVNMLKYTWVYFGNTLKPMVWSIFLRGTRFSTGLENSLISNILAVLSSHEELYPTVNSVFVAAILALAYLTYPRDSGCMAQKYPNLKEYQDVIVLRFFVNAMICLMPIIAIFL